MSIIRCSDATETILRSVAEELDALLADKDGLISELQDQVRALEAEKADLGNEVAQLTAAAFKAVKETTP